MTPQQNFFALIKDDSGSCQIKRLRVNQSLQAELIQIFEDQRILFEQGIDTEVVFNGDWKPDSNEVLTISDISESVMMKNAVNANASSFPDVVIANFSNEPIKAIFTGITKKGQTKVFVQKFSSRQALSLSQLPLIKMQTGNTFVKTTEDIFTIDNKLVAIIEDDKTKFKSFHNARMVFDLSDYYKEATNDDLTQMAQHASLHIADLESFIKEADAQVRKMAHSIERSGLLDNYTVSQISTAAENFPDIPVSINNGKITLPRDKKELKEVLHFLLEDIYKGPLSGNDFLTNSKREL
ncbi:Kiwa anti-phage protein KwaB-like domain-containing protein [Cellvibrio sp. ARAG 10.3]|uniref:Kiwa anti-phage protein KwaB-like domain-containing protein n=1 Tax=Cellvibrio sp. ARAG 10.3 TaxID=3451358 RepID=UPI003F44FE9C